GATPAVSNEVRQARAGDRAPRGGRPARPRGLPSLRAFGRPATKGRHRTRTRQRPDLAPCGRADGNLDSHTGAEIVELLLELRERRGMTVVLATHDVVVASRCERIVRLLDGRVLDVLDVPAPPALGPLLDRI